MNNEEIQGYVVMEATLEPMKPKILNDVNEPNLFYATFETCLQSFDILNRNKRNYWLRPMQEALKADHLLELMRKGTWCGENGHPDSNDIKRILSIDMTKICHRIMDVEFRGNLLYGKIQTLNDDMWGKQFTMHILQGLMPSFSLRALAAITKQADGTGVIKTKPHIVTYDRVILPSHREAYMNNDVPVTITRTGTTESFVPTEEQFMPADGNSFDDMTNAIESSKIPEALDFVKTESKRVKELASWFDANFDTVTLLNENTVRVETEFGDKVYITLEDYIRNDITSIFTKIHNL